tara:strand:- start:1890 stop:2186 length:297 start_codon:yes stop_codon:yes gene_type:complete
MNDEVVFEGPEQFSDYFKANQNLLAVFPWGNHICNTVANINKGCGCKKKKRKQNAKDTYSKIINDVLRNNKSLLNSLKNTMKVKKIVFKLDGEILLEH